MGSINRPSDKPKIFTHGGVVAKRITNEQQLQRSVLSCLLGENEFYEDGKSIKERIIETASKCSPLFVYQLAKEARHVHGLRHVPLLLLLDLVKRKEPIIDQLEGGGILRTKHAVANVIRRADDMTELVALYYSLGNEQKKKPKGQGHMANRQLRDGLALAFCKFDEYNLAKYDRDGPVKIRDVMFLAHPKPKNEDQAQLFKRVAEKKLQVPDTWEVELSAGKDKKETFERLLKEGKLGYLALLRNLRNMMDAGCNEDLVREAILARKGAELVFPFRFTAAARACPRLESTLDKAMLANIEGKNTLEGQTIVLVDVSGSMDRPISSRSDITRMDTACTLASIINAEKLRVFSFSNRLVEVPARRGMAGVDAIIRSQQHSSTNLAQALNEINRMPHDRLIVITDEQATGRYERIPDPVCNLPYMINVASAKNGVGYYSWVHIDGFSEAVLKYIYVIEKELSEGEYK